MSILLAGGAGYIGSHTAVELIKAGYDVIIVDNYDNSCPEVINRIERITGIRPDVYEADVRDTEAMRQVFSENEIDFVIHRNGQLIPVEVKSADNTRAKSLKVYMDTCKPAYAIKLSAKNFAFEDNKKIVPLYAAFCI